VHGPSQPRVDAPGWDVCQLLLHGSRSGDSLGSHCWSSGWPVCVIGLSSVRAVGLEHGTTSGFLANCAPGRVKLVRSTVSGVIPGLCSWCERGATRQPCPASLSCLSRLTNYAILTYSLRLIPRFNRGTGILGSNEGRSYGNRDTL